MFSPQNFYDSSKTCRGIPEEGSHSSPYIPGLVSQSITLRNLASLIGLLESARPAIWRAQLHFRHLQSDLIRGLQMNQESYDALTALSPSACARVELAWWLKHTLYANGSPAHLPPPDMTITTDASKKYWDVSVSLQLDNTTAIAYINNKGGTRSPQLMTLALEMGDWCQARDILVIASHIPGRDNVSADRESRDCLLYTSPSPRDGLLSRMPSSA